MPITDLAGNPAADFSSSAAFSGYTLELCDLKTDTLLADLTGAATFTIRPRRTGTPLSLTANLAADNVDIRAIWDDGDGLRKLTKLRRTLKVRLAGVLVAHVIVWHLAYTADANSTTVEITGYDALKTLKGRPYRDATGNLIDPDIASPIAAATILRTGVENSISNSGPAGDQEGWIPIDTTTGTFDEVVGAPPLAPDLGVELTDWPLNLDELMTLLSNSGGCDIWVDPVDTAMGYDPGIIGALNVATRRGSDLSDTVHFDWDTGDHNAATVDRTDDGDEMQNKLIYYLGKKQKSGNGWQGNISATETTPEDLSAYLALEEDSRDAYWTVMRFRIIDDDGANLTRKLYHEIWKEEVRGSVDGQELIHVTPSADSAFQPFKAAGGDYDPGDTVALNISDRCGPALAAATQRIDGFDVTVDTDGLGAVSPLQTLQDNA